MCFLYSLVFTHCFCFVCVCFFRCCNTCDDVREAYRRRGWAFKSADTIEQCKREGFTQKMQEQKNEGCQVYGFLEVNKVTVLNLFIINIISTVTAWFVSGGHPPGFGKNVFRNV